MDARTLFVAVTLISFGFCWGCTRQPGKGSAKNAADSASAEQAEQKKPVAFPMTTTRMVNYKEAIEKNPQLKIVENKINTNDPLLAPAKAYKAIGSRAELLALSHNIDLHKAQWDKYPTYAEFEDLVKQSNVQFKGLYPWQAYSYNEDDGSINILEDPDFKKQMYKDAGLPEPTD